MINKKEHITKFTILFITHDFNYFVNNNGSFYRMYQNLIHFHNHKNFNVIVLQLDREKNNENKNLKKNIKCYYYKSIKFLKNEFINFNDFNPFFISKFIKIIKKHSIDIIHFDFCYGLNVVRLITKIPICYNAYNVEKDYWKQVGSHYYKIPFFLRYIYSKYIYFVEKYAVKYSNCINSFSEDDMKRFIELYNIPKKKNFR